MNGLERCDKHPDIFRRMGRHGPGRCPKCIDEDVAAAELAQVARAAEMSIAQIESKGACSCCGQEFVERTRKRPRFDRVWTGLLAEYSSEGVCPQCYNQYAKDRGLEREWTEEERQRYEAGKRAAEETERRRQAKLEEARLEKEEADRGRAAEQAAARERAADAAKAAAAREAALARARGEQERAESARRYAAERSKVVLWRTLWISALTALIATAWIAGGPQWAIGVGGIMLTAYGFWQAFFGR